MPMLPKVPPASSSPMFVPSLREGESGVAKTEPTLPKRHRRPTISPRLACGPPEWKNSAAKIPEEICRQRRRFPKFRAHVSSLRTSGRLRRRNVQSDTADVARGPTGSPCSVLSPTNKSTRRKNYPWRPRQDSASCRFLVRSGLCPRKWPWRLCKSDDCP